MSPDPVALVDLTPHQLVSEIHQLSTQYRAEVSTKRRTWPASIRERVLALRRQGVSAHRIAELSGVPYTTVVFWCGPQKVAGKVTDREGRFLPVVANRRSHAKDGNSTVVPPTVETPAVASATAVALTVVLPGGVEVRGLSSATEVAALYRAIRGVTGERA